MDSSEIQAFVRRPWQEIAESKTAYWAARFRHDWRIPWNAAQALLLHARAVGTRFPTDDNRRLDLTAHLALRARLDSAAHAFPRR